MSVWDTVKGNWTQFKGMVRERWGELTDDEIDKIAGDYQQLIGHLQKKYGIDASEAQSQADDWASSIDLNKY